MDDIRYNASHAPNLTAHKAIQAADKQPKRVDDAVEIIKRFLKLMDMELVGRISIKDKKTGRTWD